MASSSQPTLIALEKGKVIGNGYIVMDKLGEGTFGAVYEVKKADKEYALKAESVDEKMPLLKLELHVMRTLKEKKAKHTVELIDKGRHENFNYVIMKFLGKSMQDMKKTGPDGHLTLGCAIGASIQCLKGLEELHWAGFLHRDVKPGNFAVGRAEYDELRIIYCLDFGMARKYVNEENTMHPPRKRAPFRGTPRYAALASHELKEHGRQADVESWFYMLVDFTNAKLPWKTVADIKDLGEMKKKCRKEPLISQFFKECPTDEYKKVLTHIDSLTYFSEPDYGLIYKTLKEAMKKKNVKEFPYDWEDVKSSNKTLK